MKITRNFVYRGHRVFCEREDWSLNRKPLFETGRMSRDWNSMELRWLIEDKRKNGYKIKKNVHSVGSLLITRHFDEWNLVSHKEKLTFSTYICFHDILSTMRIVKAMRVLVTIILCKSHENLLSVILHLRIKGRWIKLQVVRFIISYQKWFPKMHSIPSEIVPKAWEWLSIISYNK